MILMKRITERHNDLPSALLHTPPKIQNKKKKEKGFIDVRKDPGEELLHFYKNHLNSIKMKFRELLRLSRG